MKTLYKILLFLFPLLCLVIAHTQSIYSIQQKVLQSIQSKMGKKGFAGASLDSEIINITQKQINEGLEHMNKALSFR